MEQITEREQKLLGYLKMMINTLTIASIYQDHLHKLNVWRSNVYEEVGLSIDWQNEMLHILESEFGVIYTKINKTPDKEEVKDE